MPVSSFYIISENPSIIICGFPHFVSATFAADEEGNITSVFTFTLAKKVSVVVWVIIGVAVLLLLGIIIFLIMRRKNNKQAA